MSTFADKKYKVHPNTRKSLLINDLQGLAQARIDRQYYSLMTIFEIYKEIERAKEARLNGLEYAFVYRKEKTAKNDS